MPSGICASASGRIDRGLAEVIRGALSGWRRRRYGRTAQFRWFRRLRVRQSLNRRPRHLRRNLSNHGPQERPGDFELAGAIRPLVDERPTHGYQRIAALLKRKRRADGMAPVIAKLLSAGEEAWPPARTPYRTPATARAYGQVVTIRSNCRWCSDALAFTYWNGEIVRVAFALDCHDCEAISWVATTAGISGGMIRDMMARRVDSILAAFAHRIRCNGFPTTARSSPPTEPSKSPWRSVWCCASPQSNDGENGMAEAFVKPLQARLRPGWSNPGCRWSPCYR